MIFTSINFLVFLGALLLCFIVIRGTQNRQYLLLFASYIFYGAWNTSYLLLIAFCSVFSWWSGEKIHKASSQHSRKLWLGLSVTVNLGILAYFKYANFFANNVSNLLGLDAPMLNILLPVGISFFTFQAMSYTIDLYRGNINNCSSLPKFMLFVAFFPQLVAGPIVRASEFLPQLNRPIQLRRQDFVVGSQIFLGGAIQKVLLADNLSVFVDPIFANPSLYSAATLWLGLMAYSVQIFCDFCGYSLMAIGVSRLFGFTLMENFRMPYVSLSITEFWRRWHISLSFWLRDYLYISLGGNRKGEFFTRLNLMITMLLGGLWHGASWNFVVWGALHGFALIVHKFWMEIQIPFKQSFIYRTLAWGVTYVFVILCWLPFRSPDFNTTLTYLKRMFSLDTAGIQWLQPQALIILGLVALWHLLYKENVSWLTRYPTQKLDSFATKCVILAALMLIALYAPLSTSPFIYFQF